MRDWLVYSDVHILVVAAGWMLGNSAVFDIVLPSSFLFVASVGAFLVYRVDRLLITSPEDTLNAPGRLDFSVRYRWPLLALAVVLALLAAMLAITMQVLWLEVAIVLGALGLVYPLSILPGRRRPKDIAWLKTSLIAACWVGGGVILPIVLFGGKGSPIVLFMAGLYRVVWIFPNLLAADWLDREGDRRVGSGNLVRAWSLDRMQVALRVSAGVVVLLAIGLVSMGVPIVLMIVDLAGFMLLTMTAWRSVRRAERQDMAGTRASAVWKVWLDLLVAWPLVVWILAHLMG